MSSGSVDISEQKGSGSYITSNLLDGILCETWGSSSQLSGGQESCSNAKEIGHAVTTSGQYVKYELVGFDTVMKMWFFPNGNVLKYNVNEEGVSKANIASSIEDFRIPNRTNKITYYTKENFAGKKSISDHFGVASHDGYGNEQALRLCNWTNEHMNSTNVCTMRGMRLPMAHETSMTNGTDDNSCRQYGYSGNSGIPSWSYTDVHTATALTSNSGMTLNWELSTQNSGRAYSSTEAIRCVSEQ